LAIQFDLGFAAFAPVERSQLRTTAGLMRDAGILQQILIDLGNLMRDVDQLYTHARAVFARLESEKRRDSQGLKNTRV
jgi:hypothetical protein